MRHKPRGRRNDEEREIASASPAPLPPTPEKGAMPRDSGCRLTARSGRLVCRCDHANATRDYPSWLFAPPHFSHPSQSLPMNCSGRSSGTSSRRPPDVALRRCPQSYRLVRFRRASSLIARDDREQGDNKRPNKPSPPFWTLSPYQCPWLV